MYDITNFSEKRRTMLSLLVCLVVALFTNELQFPSNFEMNKTMYLQILLDLRYQ